MYKLQLLIIRHSIQIKKWNKKYNNCILISIHFSLLIYNKIINCYSLWFSFFMFISTLPSRFSLLFINSHCSCSCLNNWFTSKLIIMSICGIKLLLEKLKFFYCLESCTLLLNYRSLIWEIAAAPCPSLISSFIRQKFAKGEFSMDIKIGN